jgi:hypothetical protein
MVGNEVGSTPGPLPAPWPAFSRCESLFCDRKAARGRAAQARGPAPPDFRRNLTVENYVALS